MNREQLIGTDSLGRVVSIHASKGEDGKGFFTGHVHEINGASDWGMVSESLTEFQDLQTFPGMGVIWPSMTSWAAQRRRYRIHSAAMHHAVQMTHPGPTQAKQTGWENQVKLWESQLAGTI